MAFSVVLNGKPRDWFKGQRGIRQGDPLSPFLFTLAVDVLSCMLSKRLEEGVVKGIKVGSNELEISHVQFADNTIHFLQEDEENLKNVISLLQVFEVVFGLKINRRTCGVVRINLEDREEVRLARLVRCDVLSWPFTYLGMPLGGNPRSVSFWEPVVKKISKRLESLKGSYFSLGGRITLIKSCLSCIPTYYLSLFKIPIRVANKLEKIMRFLME